MSAAFTLGAMPSTCPDPSEHLADELHGDDALSVTGCADLPLGRLGSIGRNRQPVQHPHQLSWLSVGSGMGQLPMTMAAVGEPVAARCSLPTPHQPVPTHPPWTTL